jgi:hypothetical protein
MSTAFAILVWDKVNSLTRKGVFGVQYSTTFARSKIETFDKTYSHGIKQCQCTITFGPWLASVDGWLLNRQSFI